MRNTALLEFQDHYGNLPFLIYVHFNLHSELNPPAKLMQYHIQTVSHKTLFPQGLQKDQQDVKKHGLCMCCYINALLNPRIDLFSQAKGPVLLTDL